MRNNIKSRVIEEAEYVIKTKETIRNTAKYFKTSKSTIHKDISERLKKIDKDLYEKINAIMENHIEQRHINGGEATRKKYSSVAKRNTNRKSFLY